MEMGSSSLPGGGGGGGGGGAGSSDSSLNGLKFGKKIYFEDVGIGVSNKSGNGSSSSSSISERGGTPILGTTTVRKGRGGVLQGGGKPPRCQVEGCNVDLSNAKAYHSRHKVCGMHSKFPKVIVAGTEQRFCQQCSRFHQLSEFDQGKRSCRRRLAGHNERRRKPQPGSLISSRYGRLSSENGTRIGGFLMDFTTYPRLPRRDAWSTIRAGSWAGHQSSASGRLVPHQWQCITETSTPANVFSQPSHPYLQGSAGGTVFSSSRIPSNECFSGVSDSSCALSLLSNQPWCARNQTSDLVVNSLMNGDGTSMAQSTAPHSVAVTSFTNNTWNFKNNEVSGGSEDMPRDFAMGQVSEPISGHFSDELQIAQQGDRQYMELGHSRNYGSSSNQVHWSH